MCPASLPEILACRFLASGEGLQGAHKAYASAKQHDRDVGLGFSLNGAQQAWIGSGR